AGRIRFVRPLVFTGAAVATTSLPALFGLAEALQRLPPETKFRMEARPAEPGADAADPDMTMRRAGAVKAAPEGAGVPGWWIDVPTPTEAAAQPPAAPAPARATPSPKAKRRKKDKEMGTIIEIVIERSR